MVEPRNRHQYPRLAIVASLCLFGLAAFWLLFWKDRPSGPTKASGLVSLTSIQSEHAPSLSPQPEVQTGENASDVHPQGKTYPLDPILKLAREAKDRFDREVTDYAATLMKRERIRGKLTDEVTIQLKVRNRKVEDGERIRPMEVYLYFEAPKSVVGREVIWSEGRNQGKLVAHEGGLLNVMRVSLEPTSSLAMMGNKYPVTQIGIGNLLTKLIDKGERDRLVENCQVVVHAGHRVGDRSCQLIQVTHPELRDGLDFHVAQIFIDEERQIPLRYASYLWPKGSEEPPLEEEYTYIDVTLNPGFSDEDFDPNNPKYDFPGK